MLFPLPSTWNMAKDAPNHVPINMIGLAQTSRKILKGGVVTIFLVVQSTQYSPQFNCDCTGIPLSTFYVDNGIPVQ